MAVSYTESLQVLSTFPASYARNIATDSVVTITFSTDITKDSLNNSVFITDETTKPIEGSFTYYGPKRTLEFKPSDGFPAGTTVRVLVKGDHTEDDGKHGVVSAVGVPLFKDYTLVFSTTGISSPPPPVLRHPAQESLLSLESPYKEQIETIDSFTTNENGEFTYHTNERIRSGGFMDISILEAHLTLINEYEVKFSNLEPNEDYEEETLRYMAILFSPIPFRWSELQDVDGYEVQISRHPSFNPLYLPTQDRIFVDNHEWISQHAFDAGLYYWRIRGVIEGETRVLGSWSKTGQFTIQELLPPPQTFGDESPHDILELDDPIRVLSTFPEDGFASVGTNLKSVIVKIDRPLPESKVTSDLFQGYSQPVDDSSEVTEFHTSMDGNVYQIINNDGTALLVWELNALD